MLVPDEELAADRLVAEVTSRTSDPQRLAVMSQAAQQLMPAGAANRVARVILEQSRVKE